MSVEDLPLHALNFRQKFERWHKATYGYIATGEGTALSFVYKNDKVQARWEGWQAHATTRNASN